MINNKNKISDGNIILVIIITAFIIIIIPFFLAPALPSGQLGNLRQVSAHLCASVSSSAN